MYSERKLYKDSTSVIKFEIGALFIRLTFTLILNFVQSVYFDFFLNFVKERSKGLLKHTKKIGECYFLFFFINWIKKNKVDAAVNISTLIPATNIHTIFTDDHNNC